MRRIQNPFSPAPIFLGFGFSAAYGAVVAAAIWFGRCPSEVAEFGVAYFRTYNSFVSGGLIFSVAFLIYLSQRYVPEAIERALPCPPRYGDAYLESKSKYESALRSVRFSVAFAGVAAIIFTAAEFSSLLVPNIMMVVAGCLQYAAGVYIGRKLFHVTEMVQSIGKVDTFSDIQSVDRLAEILPIVSYISTLTAVAVCVGVVSYYRAPFARHSEIGQIASTFMLFPAVIAVPVLLFAYYPRSVVRRLYERAIHATLADLRRSATGQRLPAFELEARMIELRKTMLEEVSQKLRYSIEDMPLVVIVGIAIIGIIKD